MQRSAERWETAPTISNGEQPGTAAITSPTAGALVPWLTTVTGSFSGVTGKVWLAIHATDGRWYLQSNNACAGDHTFTFGTQWQVDTYFGEVDRNYGEVFDVVVLIADTNAHKEFDTKMQGWCPEDNYPGLLTIELPDGVEEKARLRLMRESLGRIGFSALRDGNTEVYVMNPDGSVQSNLTNNATSDSEVSWSPGGSKVAFVTDRTGDFEIYMMNVNGTDQVNITNNAAGDFGPSWSSDGSKIVFVSNRHGNYEVYYMDADGLNVTRLTSNGADEASPSWCPDGRIAFSSLRDGQWEIYVMDGDGSNQTRLTSLGGHDTAPECSPDSRSVVFNKSGSISVVDVASELIVDLYTGGDAVGASWSPDGNQIAFDKNGSNRDIYVMQIDGSNVVRLTTDPTVDQSPRWGPQPPAAYWPLDGNAADASGGGHDGSASAGTAYVAGATGRAAHFDGVNDSITVPDGAGLDGMDALTVEAWVYPLAYSSYGSSPFISGLVVKWGTGGQSDDSWFLQMYGEGDVSPAGTVQFVVGGNGGSANSGVNSNTPLPLHEWSLVTAVFKQGEYIRIYINGAISGSASAQDYPVDDTGQVVTIGTSPGGRFFNGFIDEATVYDGVRIPVGSVTPLPGGAFVSTGNLTTKRVYHEAVFLPGGTVVAMAGFDGVSHLTSAEVYDSSTGQFSVASGAMSIGRRDFAAVLLHDGTVLVTGGRWNSAPSGALVTAEIYDPSTQTFTTLPQVMGTARYLHEAVLLPDGRVLIVGGHDLNGELASAEVYDPATGAFTPVSNEMSDARIYLTATVLANGKLLVVGGDNGVSSLATADLYDPATNSFTLAGSMAQIRRSHAATLLPDGRVLITGGESGSVSFSSAELYDPSSNSFTPAGSMAVGRHVHWAGLLPDGRVLVAGGHDGAGVLVSAELYDPATDGFSATGDLVQERYVRVASVLEDGRILVIGGGDNDGYLDTAELYVPNAAPRAPLAPRHVIVVAGDGEATVRWLPPLTTGGSSITSYTVTASPGGATKNVSGDLLTTVFTSLINGTPYTFTVTATNAEGSSPTSASSPPVTPISVPEAAFTNSTTTGDGPLTVQFTDASTGGPASWLWIFGDGATSVQQSPSHTFTRGGVFTVSLTVTNAAGSDVKTEIALVIVTGYSSKIMFIREVGSYGVYTMWPDGSEQTALTEHLAADAGCEWSPDGLKVLFISDRDGNGEIYSMNADGTGATNLSNHPATENGCSWSPDGMQIAFDTNRDGNSEIYIMNSDGSGQTNITNEALHDEQPAWSPDGTKIAFLRYLGSNLEIYAMNADGSNQTRLTNSPSADTSPRWAPDGSKIVFRSDRDGNPEIYEMNADGSGQNRLTNNPAADYEPDYSPDGTQIVFRSNRDGNFEIYVMNADGTNPTRITNNALFDFGPRWTPAAFPMAAFTNGAATGNGSLTVQFTDMSTGDPTSWLWHFGDGGTSTLENPSHTYKRGGVFSVRLEATNMAGSDVQTKAALVTVTGWTAKIVYTCQSSSYEICEMDANGARQIDVTANGVHDDSPAWSPDGTQIAYGSDRSGDFEIYVANADGSGATNVTNESGLNGDPIWSPDGTRIGYAYETAGNRDVWVMDADGTGKTRLTTHSGFDFRPTWSPDGRRIAFTSDRTGNNEVWVMDADGSQRMNLTNDPAPDGSASWSPDGMFITFATERNGASEIYVMNADGGNPTNLTNHPLWDYSPSWSPDGTQIMFNSNRVDGNQHEIFVMDADGGNQTRLTTNVLHDLGARWSGAVFTPLAAYYAFESNATDNSTNGHDGALSGGVGYGDGVFGQAASFDGSNDAVTIPDGEGLDGMDALTVQAWVYPQAYSNYAYPQISGLVGKWGTGGQGDDSWFLQMYGNGASEPAGTVQFVVGGVSGATNSSVISTSALPLNEWSLVTAVFKRSEYVRIYIDGELDVSASAQDYPVQNTGQAVNIGTFPGGRYFDGLIDEVTIYDGVRLPDSPVILFSDNFEYDDSPVNHGWAMLGGDPLAVVDPADPSNRALYVESRAEDIGVSPGVTHSFGEMQVQRGMEFTLRFYDTGEGCNNCDVAVRVRFDSESKGLTTGWYNNANNFWITHYFYPGSGNQYESVGLRSPGWHTITWRVDSNGGVDLLIDGNLVVDNLMGANDVPVQALSSFDVFGGSDPFTYSFYVDDVLAATPP